MTTFEEQKKKSAKPLLWISMISMSMVFAGLTSALVVRKAEGNWLVFDYPIWFYISTALIILSSFTMNWAKNNVKKDNLDMANKGFLMDFIIRLRFCSFAVPYLGRFV